MTSVTSAWIYLLAAGALEVLMTTVYRYTAGMTKLAPSVAFVLIGLASLYFLNRALASIPIGTGYAVWTGIGAAGTALVGIAFYNEPSTTIRLVLLTVLVGSIVGLKLVSSS